MKLNSKQLAFIAEYRVDRNGKQAAIRAGYAPGSAEVTASRLLTNAKVLEAVNKAIVEINESTKIDAEYVRMRHVEIDQMDVADILDNVGNVKKIQEWPKVWRTSISGVDLHEMITGDIETIIRKVKWPDKIRNLELLGKHVSVQAYKDKLEVDPQEHKHSLDAKTLKTLKTEILKDL